jgi:hypothetical protein
MMRLLHAICHVCSSTAIYLTCIRVITNSYAVLNDAAILHMYAGAVTAELKDGHSYGVACVAFSPKDDLIVSAGFKHDARILVSFSVTIRTCDL